MSVWLPTPIEPPWNLIFTGPKCDHVWCDVTPLIDCFSLDLFINPCSMACSSPFTITPCACCHLAVLCLQSYSVHLSDTIYGEQFVVYHGNSGFWRTIFFFSAFSCVCCTLDMGVSLTALLQPVWKKKLSICSVFRYVKELQSPFRLWEKCIVTKLKKRQFSPKRWRYMFFPRQACKELSPALFDTIKWNECAAIRCLFCLIVAWLCHCCLCSQIGLSPLRGGSITKWQPLRVEQVKLIQWILKSFPPHVLRHVKGAALTLFWFASP